MHSNRGEVMPWTAHIQSELQYNSVVLTELSQVTAQTSVVDILQRQVPPTPPKSAHRTTPPIERQSLFPLYLNLSCHVPQSTEFSEVTTVSVLGLRNLTVSTVRETRHHVQKLSLSC